MILVPLEEADVLAIFDRIQAGDRNVDIARDFAVSERESLTQKVAALENQIREMESNQLLLYHRRERIRAKNTEIKDARVGYEQLLAQVSIYKERVADLTSDLEANYSKSLTLAEKEVELLKGSELDYVEEMVGSSFQVKNPNATSSCGCGNSFSV